MGIKLLHHSKIKNRKGFTIIEILLVLGLASFMLLVNVSFLHKFLENLKKVETESFDEAELAITNRRFANILAKLNPSFNRINIGDVNSTNFFDYYPDMPRSAFAGTTGARQVTLSLNQGGRNAFYFFTSEEATFPGISMDPVHAYTENATPLNMNFDGTVTYKGLNSIPAIGASTKLMTQVFGTRWKNGELFIISSPVYQRPLNAAGGIDLYTTPRTPTFVGYVDQDDLLPFSSADFTVINTHPFTGANYSSADTYFRTLPPVGGASPFVKIEAVRLIRLQFKSSAGYPASYGDLYMSQWTNGQFTGDEIVIRKIKEVRFKRTSVTMPLITLEIDK